jgi:hypothetical protein
LVVLDNGLGQPIEGVLAAQKQSGDLATAVLLRQVLAAGGSGGRDELRNVGCHVWWELNPGG